MTRGVINRLRKWAGRDNSSRRLKNRLRKERFESSSLEALESRALLAVVPQGFTETEIASRLSSPTAMQIAPDGRIFVGQQNGVIRLIKNDALVTTPVGSVSADGSGERGVQGMAIDPNFSQNGYLYLYYTRSIPSSHNVVSRVTISGDSMVANSEQILFELPNLSTVGNPIWHMGGSIEVTADGYIFFASGDHQNANLAQRMDSPFGKIMRIRTDGSIPEDNPFYASTTGMQRAIWSLGLRNPFTGAVQPETGKYFLNDVGAGSFEEVNQEARGANFGWPTTEGYFNAATFPNFTNPVHAYSHSVGCAITGGAFYPVDSIQYPENYEGKYFFSEFCNGQIRVIDPNNGANSTVFLSGANFPMGIEMGTEGSLYYIERGAGAGGADGTNRGSVHKVSYVDRVAPRIAQHPQSKLVSLGFEAEFTVAASGTNPLNYRWQRAEAGGEFVDIPGATSATFILAAPTLDDNQDRFRVVITNVAGTITSEEAVLTVTADRPPTAAITLPAAGLRYNAGDTIQFAGLGTDEEDGSIPPQNMTWVVDFHHHDHSHPFFPATSGISNGQFVIPTTGETDPDVFYRISLKVTDSIGLTSTTFVDVIPNLANIRLDASIPGVRIELDGQPKSAPFSVDGVVNISRTVKAPSFAQAGGQTYEFDRWENGETNREVTFSTPPSGVTWKALYRPATVTFLSDLPYAAPPTNGWGPPERDRSNGETGENDGNPITLQGVVFEKGLGVHADGEVAFNLNGGYDRFLATIGVDDETGANGSVVFKVIADGSVLYESPTMLGDSASIDLDINVAGRNRLVLQVGTAGDGNGSDHADWALARVVAKVTNPNPPSAPTDLTAQGISSVIKLNWEDKSDNEFGFRVERKLAGESEWTVAANVPPNQVSYVDSGLFLDSVYEYKVTAFNTFGTSEGVLAQAATRGGYHINFQPAAAPAAYDYLVDSGAVYGDRGGQFYGWNADNSLATRDRDNPASPDQRYDTMIHMQKPENPNASWEISVPNGAYNVRIVGGEASFRDGNMNTLVEGVEAFNGGVSDATPFLEGNVVVNVRDGRLTISNGPNAVNNKLVFVDIQPIATVEIRPTVLGNNESMNVVFNRPMQEVDLTDFSLAAENGANLLANPGVTLQTVDYTTYTISGYASGLKAATTYEFSLNGEASDITDFFGNELQQSDIYRFFLTNPLQSLGDINNDLAIDIRDFALMRAAFGSTTQLNPADLNQSGRVDLVDFAILRRNFGRRIV